jgi:hypothetical protein
VFARHFAVAPSFLGMRRQSMKHLPLIHGPRGFEEDRKIDLRVRFANCVAETSRLIQSVKPPSIRYFAEGQIALARCAANDLAEDISAPRN